MSEIERAIEKKEYIERGELIAFVREVRKKLPKDSRDFFTRDEMLLNFQQYLELQKAADVEPVVRAKWEPVDTADGYVEYRCSNCGIRGQERYARCSCGAHMERSGDK
jgi:hypothetical protein